MYRHLEKYFHFLQKLCANKNHSARNLPPPVVSAQPPVLTMPGSDGRPYPALTAIIQNFGRDSSSSPAILMLGDSVAERVSRDDVDKRTLAELVAEQSAPEDFLAVTRSAYNPLIYKWLLLALDAQPHKPKSIILPINLRSFSPQWHLNPNWQLQQDLQILFTYHQHRNTDFPSVQDEFSDAAAHLEFEALPVEYALSRRKTIGAFQEIIRDRTEAVQIERLREIFVFHYTHLLEETHPKLMALKECVELAKNLSRKLIVYITPINMDAGLRCVGKEFAGVVNANIATIRRTLASQGIEVLDWSGSIRETAFFHANEPTEHLNATGRQQLAALIGAQLK